MSKPKQLETVDLTELRKICQEYIDYLNGEIEDEITEDGASDYDHYIVEKALTAIFGDRIFDFINEKIE